MISAETAKATFTGFNLLYTTGYVLQMMRLARDTTGARAVSATTWLIFMLSHLLAVIYAVLRIEDVAMAGVSAANMACCAGILLLTRRARRRPGLRSQRRSNVPAWVRRSARGAAMFVFGLGLGLGLTAAALLLPPVPLTVASLAGDALVNSAAAASLLALLTPPLLLMNRFATRGGRVGREGPEPASANRWVALDAMRGLAALAVVLYHLRWDWHGYALVHIRHAFYAVDFFFVLSGFVMAATYGAMRTPLDLTRFTLKRAGRVLPLHFAALAAFIALETAIHLADRAGLNAGRETFATFTGLTPLLAQATMTFGLIPGLDWMWNHPCWSIAVELWTYLLFGLTVLALRRGRLALWAALAGLGLAVMALTPEGLAVTSGPAIFRCLLSFFLGCLVHAAYTTIRARGTRLGTGAQVFGLGLAGALTMLPAESAWSLLIPFAFAWLVLGFAFDEGRPAHALSVRPLVRLGELSFSIYLVHVPVWFALESGLRAGAFASLPWLLPDASAAIPVMVSPLGSTLGADALMLAYVGLVLAVSAWTHRRIELPARIWSRRVADRIGSGALNVAGPLGLVPETLSGQSSSVLEQGTAP